MMALLFVFPPHFLCIYLFIGFLPTLELLLTLSFLSQHIQILPIFQDSQVHPACWQSVSCFYSNTSAGTDQADRLTFSAEICSSLPVPHVYAMHVHSDGEKQFLPLSLI